jgi:Transposase DDE domain group 1
MKGHPMSTQCTTKKNHKSTGRAPRSPLGRTRTRTRSEPRIELSDRPLLSFPGVGRREVLAAFDGGGVSSDGGAHLLRKAEEITGIIRQFAGCFTDYCDPDLIEHELAHLIAQRVFGLALGYEDLNDHDDLRHDPLLATVVGKPDPTGQSRRRESDQGNALAGKSTLNRIELTPRGADQDDRYKKITCSTQAVDELFAQEPGSDGNGTSCGPNSH